MRYKISPGLLGYKITSQEGLYLYRYKHFSLSGILKDSSGMFLAELKRKSWWSYSYELTTEHDKYTFKSKALGYELVSEKTGKQFIDGYSIPYKQESTMVRNGASYELEINNSDHALALLVVSCFFVSLRW